MNNKTRVLVVDDDRSIRSIIKSGFSESGFEIFEADNCNKANVLARECNPELVILDLGLPDRDGIFFLQQFRSWSSAPVIILSARGEEQSKIAALDLGANDYVSKPFAIGEFQARCRAALRWAIKKNDDVTECNSHGVKINFIEYVVTKNGEAVHLTPIEFKLLALLAKQSGRVLTHKQLLTEVWGHNFIDQTHYLRIFMKALRNKLEDDPTNPRLLITESGVGYRFQEED